ncbi:MAG: hypothetical protein QXY16_02095 [Nanopusillaceae archaeon]
MKLDEVYISFIEKYYKQIFVISISILIVATTYLLYRFLVFNSIVDFSVEITGGNLIVFPKLISELEVESILRDLGITDYNLYVSGGNIYIETSAKDIKEFLNILKEKNISEELITVQEFSSYIGELVLEQLIRLFIISTVLISIFIMLRFRKKQPVFGILLVIFWDFILVLTLINLFGLKLGFIGVVAMLGILGFAIDNNIVLATNVFQEKELSFNDRIKLSLKVGLLMEIFILFVLIPLILIVDLPIVKEFSMVWLFIVISDTYSYLFLNVAMYKYFEKRNQTSTTTSTSQ